MSRAGHKLKASRNLARLNTIVVIILMTTFFSIYVLHSDASNKPSAQSLSLAGTTAHFAAIGDYGAANSNELAVANLIKSWNPDFIITLGDNNYPDGAASTIDSRIGQYFHGYIAPYTGTYGGG